MELIQKNNQLYYGPPSSDAPTVYKNIQDYERHFEAVISNVEQHMFPPLPSEYINESTPDVISYEVKEMAFLRLAAQDNPELMQLLDEMEKSVLEKPEVQKRIEEQATSRGAFQIYNFLEELGQKHDIEYPIEEWKKDSTVAYIQGVKTDIEASHGNYDKMMDTITAVTNLMDAVDAKLVAEQIDLAEFWKECGYMSAQAQLDVPEQSLFVDVLQLECESPDLGEQITPSVEVGKALYAYEHRHESFEHMVTAAEKVFEIVDFDGIDFAKQHFDIESLAREAGTTFAKMEIEDLQKEDAANIGRIGRMNSLMTWDSQYQNIGAHMAQSRKETIEAHPEVLLDKKGQVVDSPYNPLVLKNKEIEQIVNNLEQRGEAHVDESRAVRDYAAAFTSVLDNIEQYKSAPTDDFHVMTTSRAVNVMALLKHHYQDNPEMLQTFASLEKQAYQDPERQQEIAEKASRANGHWVQECIKGFDKVHSVGAPVEEWKKAADVAYVQDIDLKFKNNSNRLQAMTQLIYEVPKMIEVVGKETAKANMDLDGFWQACGKLAVDASVRVNEREVDPQGYYQIPAYSTREDDMRFLTALSQAERSVDFYYIHNNIELGAAERQEQHAEKAQRLEDGLRSKTIEAKEVLNILYEISPSEIEKRGLGEVMQEFWTEKAKESYHLQDAAEHDKANDLIEILNQVEYAFPETGEAINAAYDAVQQEKETERNLYDASEVKTSTAGYDMTPADEQIKQALARQERMVEFNGLDNMELNNSDRGRSQSD